MATTSGNSDARMDVLLFTGAGDGQLGAGVQKLAQQVLMELSCATGSMAYAGSTHGTSLVPLLSQQSLRTEAEVMGVLAVSLLGLKRRLRDDAARAESEDGAALPDDERLDSAKVQSLVLTPGRVYLTLKIVSVAGNDAAVTIGVDVKP